MFIGYWALALAGILWAWFQPGSAPIAGEAVEEFDADGTLVYSSSGSGSDGFRADAEYAPWLLGGLVLVGLAVWVSAALRSRPSQR